MGGRGKEVPLSLASAPEKNFAAAVAAVVVEFEDDG